MNAFIILLLIVIIVLLFVINDKCIYPALKDMQETLDRIEKEVKKNAQAPDLFVPKKQSIPARSKACEGCDDYEYDEDRDNETPCANCDWCRTCEYDLSDVCCCADSPICTDVVQARTFPWCACFEEMTDDTRTKNEAIRKAWTEKGRSQ